MGLVERWRDLDTALRTNCKRYPVRNLTGSLVSGISSGNALHEFFCGDIRRTLVSTGISAAISGAIIWDALREGTKKRPTNQVIKDL